MATLEQTSIDSVTFYREAVQAVLERYAAAATADPAIETQLLIDTQHDHYQLVDVGWQNDLRVHSCILHIDIKDNKVWLQQNLTDQRVAEELVAAGIPKNRIVIGFHPPYARPYTEFAVA
jgi:hypothetical protein